MIRCVVYREEHHGPTRYVTRPESCTFFRPEEAFQEQAGTDSFLVEVEAEAATEKDRQCDNVQAKAVRTKEIRNYILFQKF